MAKSTSANDEMSTAVLSIASLLEASWSTSALERCITGKNKSKVASAYDGDKPGVVSCRPYIYRDELPKSDEPGHQWIGYLFLAAFTPFVCVLSWKLGAIHVATQRRQAYNARRNDSLNSRR